MLINCPECGKEISDKSDKCIHCGYPLQFEEKKEQLYDLWTGKVNLGGWRISKYEELMHDVFGYNSRQALRLDYNKLIAQNLTAEQVCRAVPVFRSNQLELKIYRCGDCTKSLDPREIPGYVIAEEIYKSYRYKDRAINENQKVYVDTSWYDTPITKNDNTPKCPTCGSSNIQKISGTKRFVSTGVFGLASSTIGKTMECKNCGYKW